MRLCHAMPCHVFSSHLFVRYWSMCYCLLCHSHCWALLWLFEIVARTCMYINRVHRNHIKPTTTITTVINFVAQHPFSPWPHNRHYDRCRRSCCPSLVDCRCSRCFMRRIFVLLCAHFPFWDFNVVPSLFCFCFHLYNVAVVTVIYDCPI